MCWQCIDEESVFDALDLTIIERLVSEGYEAYPPIILRDGQGADVITNPAADWLFASAATIRQQGTDTENIPYLLPLPAPGETIQVPCACTRNGCRGVISVNRTGSGVQITNCLGWNWSAKPYDRTHR